MGWFGVVVFAFIMLFMTCAMPEWRCSTLGDTMGMPHRYEWPSGCFLKVRGQWVHERNYRVMEE